jgi:hypothetical protein
VVGILRERGGWGSGEGGRTCHASSSLENNTSPVNIYSIRPLCTRLKKKRLIDIFKSARELINSGRKAVLSDLGVEECVSETSYHSLIST